MKVTVDWLKQYVDFSYSPDELAHHLTMLGLEVDSVKQITYDFENVIIGEIVDLKKHENKPLLKICDVNVGKETLRLVCGAPNVQPGIKVAVALVGGKISGNRVIEKAQIHGYESPGMICSEAELGISHQSDIIMVLNDKAQIGQDLKSYLGQSEIVIEIDLTPNRPDCLGVIGIAREIAALNKTKLNKPTFTVKEEPTKQVNDVIDVIIENPESCPRYTARYIEGIKVGPSPRWLIQKLEAVGLRTINNVVDVTNYVMMETGQPLHAFDYDLLEAHKIIVRHAKSGEKFTTLDDKEHTLTDETLMICDGKKPIALAGIMGGLNSEISQTTTNVLLESALFNPVNIRRTSKLLSISTDSSQRFERGVDPEGLTYALDRAAYLINKLAGGKVATGIIDRYPRKIEPKQVKLRVTRVNHVLGTSIAADEIIDILRRLEFKIANQDDNILIDVPSFRVDIEREIDLIEEVSRLYGFVNIAGNSSSLIPLHAAPNREEQFNELLRDYIVRIGYHEILTHSFINKKLAEIFTTYIPIKLKNPISEDLETLRTSIIPGGLQIVKWNKNRKINNQKLFEIGNTFYAENQDYSIHKELRKIAFLRTGNTIDESWLEKSRKATFFDIKGDVITLLNKLGITHFTYGKTDRKFLSTEESFEIYLNDNNIGYIGSLSDEMLKQFDLEDDVFIAELDVQALYDNYQWDKKLRPIPKYPAVKRDLAIVVDQLMPCEKVEKLIWEAGGNYLKKVELFDVYRGKQIAEDKKSFAFTLTFQSEKRTLTEKEIDMDIENILKNLKTKINAQLRA